MDRGGEHHDNRHIEAIIVKLGPKQVVSRPVRLKIGYTESIGPQGRTSPLKKLNWEIPTVRPSQFSYSNN